MSKLVRELKTLWNAIGWLRYHFAWVRATERGRS
jgi:hypothetical protein